MSIEAFATKWQVSPKTVGNWIEYVYQAFDVALPKQGNIPGYGVELLEVTAKHISKEATRHHAETGQRRRLKAAEFIEHIRSRRSQGHFQKFQKFQTFAEVVESDLDEDADDELLADMSELSRQSAMDLMSLKAAIEQREDEQVEQVAAFIERSPKRQASKLLNRLRAGRQAQEAIGGTSMERTINVAFQKLPSASQEIEEAAEISPF